MNLEARLRTLEHRDNGGDSGHCPHLPPLVIWPEEEEATQAPAPALALCWCRRPRRTVRVVYDGTP